MKKRPMEKVITSLTLNSKKPGDRKVLSLINNYCSLRPGIPALSALKNLLLTILPKEIARLQKEQKLSA